MFSRFALERTGVLVDEKDISSSVVGRSGVLLEIYIFYWSGCGIPTRRLPTQARKSVREGSNPFSGNGHGSRGGHGREYTYLTHLPL